MVARAGEADLPPKARAATSAVIIANRAKAPIAAHINHRRRGGDISFADWVLPKGGFVVATFPVIFVEAVVPILVEAG